MPCPGSVAGDAGDGDGGSPVPGERCVGAASGVGCGAVMFEVPQGMGEDGGGTRGSSPWGV